MQIDPSNEFERLREHYQQMYDGELLALAEDAGGLTETAQQVLAQELKNRSLAVEKPAPSAPRTRRPLDPAAAEAFDTNALASMGDVPLSSGHPYRFAPVTDADDQAEADPGHEYTWKTLLCECEDVDQATLLRAALARAGFESWIEGSRFGGAPLRYPRLMVAADELDEARQVAEQPIPQDILDELAQETPEDALPTGPACHAADPVLEDVEPTNQWLCESCGHRWSDPSEDDEQAPR